jgi:hypothetical protein
METQTVDDTSDDDPFGAYIAAQAAPAAPAATPAAHPAVRHSIGELAAAGLTDSEISAATGLPLETVAASPEVLVPLGESHDMRVARAIYQAAIGGERWTEKLDRFGDTHRLREAVLPDTRAASFYLENRQRGAWGGNADRGVRVVVVAMDAMRARVMADADARRDAIDAEIEPGRDPGGA